MRKPNWKLLIILTLALSLFLGVSALAEELTPGATVAADPGSPTGYTVTFVYEDSEAETVNLVGTFQFFKDGSKYKALPEVAYTPFEWEPGMYRANNNDYPASFAMEKVDGTDCWILSLPLPSGHFLYSYSVNGSTEYVSDPANPPIASTAQSASVSKLSTVNVPYAECQGASVNFDFLLPREDEQVGELVFADYEDVNGNLAPLSIYLPYGFDAAREGGYKTIYLNHGGGGNELEWFGSGNAHHIFDTLIAEGELEPTIIVACIYHAYSLDYDVITENFMNHIIPFMEENYNASSAVSDRAMAGLSMGSGVTTNVYLRQADQFGYFGILSGPRWQDAASEWDNVLNAGGIEKLQTPTIITGNGTYDNYSGDALMVRMAENGIEYDEYIVKGGHDWTVWQQLLKIIATNYLWK